MKEMYCVKLHDVYVFVGTFEECQSYFYEKVKNTLDELFCEILEYEF